MQNEFCETNPIWFGPLLHSAVDDICGHQNDMTECASERFQVIQKIFYCYLGCEFGGDGRIADGLVGKWFPFQHYLFGSRGRLTVANKDLLGELVGLGLGVGIPRFLSHQVFKRAAAGGASGKRIPKAKVSLD